MTSGWVSHPSRSTPTLQSITEASKRFGVATNTIRARVRSGALTTHTQVHGNKTRSYFDVADLVMVFGEPSAEPKVEHNLAKVGVVGSNPISRSFSPGWWNW